MSSGYKRSMSIRRISNRLSGFRSIRRGLWFVLTLLGLLLLFSMRSYADTVDLSVTYGYQNTAKAGRRLPLSIGPRSGWVPMWCSPSLSSSRSCTPSVSR